MALRYMQWMKDVSGETQSLVDERQIADVRCSMCCLGHHGSRCDLWRVVT